ncbi:hypothetical protein AMJ85_05910 [candidate division BRC1 bacterium SM23_51]|nr:MAG: hypothetical protein AMJ85_05910 [candidate division BRC1 bacterium SM23_51]
MPKGSGVPGISCTDCLGEYCGEILPVLRLLLLGENLPLLTDSTWFGHTRPPRPLSWAAFEAFPRRFARVADKLPNRDCATAKSQSAEPPARAVAPGSAARCDLNS